MIFFSYFLHSSRFLGLKFKYVFHRSVNLGYFPTKIDIEKQNIMKSCGILMYYLNEFYHILLYSSVNPVILPMF